MGYCGMASGEISIRYREFHHMVRKKRNTPGITKSPFWRMTAEKPQDLYFGKMHIFPKVRRRIWKGIDFADSSL